MLSYHCRDEAATLRLGAALWRACQPEPALLQAPAQEAAPVLVLLRGPLGAGKTTLVRGVLRAAGHSGPVKSPTFTLVEPYNVGALSVYHFDLYRLDPGASLEGLGFRDYYHSGAWLCIEWPERSPALFGHHDFELNFSLLALGRQVDVGLGPRAQPQSLPALAQIMASDGGS